MPTKGIWENFTKLMGLYVLDEHGKSVEIGKVVCSEEDIIHELRDAYPEVKDGFSFEVSAKTNPKEYRWLKRICDRLDGKTVQRRQRRTAWEKRNKRVSKWKPRGY